MSIETMQQVSEIMRSEPTILAMSPSIDDVEGMEEKLTGYSKVNESVEVIQQRRIACLRAVLTSILRHNESDIHILIEDALSLDQSLESAINDIGKNSIIDQVANHSISIEFLEDAGIKFVKASCTENHQLFQEEVCYQSADSGKPEMTQSDAITYAVNAVITRKLLHKIGENNV